MEDEEEFQKRVREVFYQTSSRKIGVGGHLAKPDNKCGINGKFTTGLMDAGMWRNNGLNTVVNTDRNLDGCKDWMDKIN